MTIITKQLPTRTAGGDREIRKSPYTMSIVELQEYADIAENRIVALEGTTSKMVIELATLTIADPTITVTSANYIIAEAQAAGGIMLPAPDTTNILLKRVFLKSTTASVADITVSSPAGTIEGIAAVTLTPGDAVEVITDGTNWHII